MQKKLVFKLLLFFLMITFLQCSAFVGCTVIGFTIGAMSDGATPEHNTYKVSEIDYIKKGTEIEITFRNGTKLVGTLLSLKLNSLEFYDSIYHELTLGQLDHFPRVGDTIQISKKSNSNVEAILLAVDYNAIWLKFLESNKIGAVNNNTIDYISFKGGNNINLVQLRDYIDSQNVPLLSDLIIQKNGTQQSIILADITELKKYNKRNGKLYGAIGGAVIDGIVILMIRASIRASPIKLF